MKFWRVILNRGAARLAAAALLTAVGTAGAADATNQPVFHASWRAASAAAAADQSLVLLIFGAEWCGPCQQLKNETLAASEFRLQAEPLHVVEVDVDTSKKMARDFAVEAIPALVLLTADGKITGRRTGFVNTAEMTAFLENGRRRADLGQWDGLAPASPLDEYVKKAASDSLTTNDLRRLVEMLGEPDPADRAGLAAILLGQREQAVPWLIEGVNNPYLGVRIGAAELLQRLAPGAAAVDPWQSPEELAVAAANLRKWWVATGALPPAAQARPADPALENSIKAGLEALRGDDPVRRTGAMAALAGAGADALPAVREALRRAEAAEAALRRKDEEALQAFVVGQLPRAIKRAWVSLEDWKAAVNRKMRSSSSSSGITVAVRIGVRDDLSEAQRLVYEHVCTTGDGLRPGPARDDVGRALQSLIAGAGGDEMVARVTDAVDIKAWVHVDYLVTRPGEEPRRWSPPYGAFQRRTAPGGPQPDAGRGGRGI